VAGAVPLALVLLFGADPGFGLPLPAAVALIAVGVAALAAGLRLAVQTIRLFASEGEGTLAPWDPTRRLVVRGPYRRVRNPMITGVALVLLGEGLILGSAAILVELAIFAAINATYMPLVEEPGLERRFGDSYRAYKRAVPRWIPRREPWSPG
jgi:protein-S-isoprenylcysteine O-methyltransferase Ste14